MKKKWLCLASAVLVALTGLAAFAACKGKQNPQQPAQQEETGAQQAAEYSVVSYPASVKHGYAVEYLGEVRRNIPSETKNEGSKKGYPKYGYTLSLTDEEKQFILAENALLNAKSASNGGGVYEKIDKNGKLYQWSAADSKFVPFHDGNGVQRTLYKHTASVGMYGGDVADSEKGIIKKITFQPRGYNSYSVTGLYAPAGEVVKIEMSEEDFNAVSSAGGVNVHIGQALYNGMANNIWAAKNFNRMPVILNTLSMNNRTAEYNAETHTYTCYVGSFWGGPIYIHNLSKPVTLTISGAVNYRHFIYGLTTKEDFEKLSASSAPYFDLEVWDYGVLQSGPLYAAEKFSYEELSKAALLWDQISSISTQVKKQGIVFLFDPFVAAGAAVAFPGRSSVNCPVGWMENALNYDTFIKSGTWGNIHEYNHNFQGWGLPDGGEVTNNALNLVAYAQHTDISSARTMTANGESGLSDWNAYTVSSWALNQVKALKRGESVNQLSIYATLLHNLGCENFIRTTGANGTANYFNKLCTVTGYDMSYFFKDLIGYDPGDAAISAVAQRNLPKFVPVGCVYQTGRSILAPDGSKQYIKTMRPFHITYGKSIDLDLSPYTLNASGLYESGTVVLPEGFSYTIKSVSAPASGSIVKKAENVYTYTPGSASSSGEIKVTLQIVKEDAAFTVEDVELIIELVQTHEKNKSMLERTVYTYEAEEYKKYATAADAYEADYAGCLNRTEEDNVNPVQNGNAEIWVPNPSSNAFMEIKGKLYCTESGDYRIALRGRHSAALYISLDGVTYTKAAELNHNTNKNDWWTDENGYTDIKGLKAGDWIYFKAVLKADYASAFVGVGWGRFEYNGTMNEEGNYVDANGNPVDEDAVKQVTLAYANGYRSSYQFPATSFSSDYLFYKQSTYTYNNSVGYEEKGALVEMSGYVPWQDAGYSESLEELFDDDDTNFIHSNKGAANDITPEHPFDITVDLKESITATTMTIYGQPSRMYLPTDFVLYVGDSADGLKELKSVTGAAVSNNNVVVTFEETTFRYYRLVCTATQVSGNPAGSKYIAYRCIKFSYPYVLSGGKQIAFDGPQVEMKGDWKTVYGASSFGRLTIGGEGMEAEFTFTGRQLMVLAEPSALPADVTVYIDGRKAVSLSGGKDSCKKGLAFLSAELEEGTHTVKLVCNSRIRFDSIVTW